jgi:hypothetical protein
VSSPRVSSRHLDDRLVSERRTHSTATGDPPIDANAHRTRRSSIFLQRMIGSMLMRVNSKCAHRVRPPLRTSWAAAAERRGVLGAPFSHGPARRSERSGRSEMIWLNSEPPKLRFQGLSRHPEYCSGSVGARDSSRRLSQCVFDHRLLVSGEIRRQCLRPDR